MALVAVSRAHGARTLQQAAVAHLAPLAAAAAMAWLPAFAAADAALGPGAVSAETRLMVDWVASTRDHAGLGFVVIDKKTATLHVFDAQARLVESTPVLLGAAVGDHTIPGVGSKPIDQVRPHERTTPAGRFVAERGRNGKGKDVIWVDYDSALSMHRVIDEVPSERRPHRLATPTVKDNRISYGCINIPVGFYESRIRPLFAEYRAMVYILPETQPLQQVFGIQDSGRAVAGRAR